MASAICNCCGKFMPYDVYGDNEELIENEDGTQWCKHCHNAHYVFCHDCGTVLDRSAFNSYRSDPNNPSNLYCNDCWGHSWFECQCGRIEPINMSYCAEGRFICPECFHRDYLQCYNCGVSVLRSNNAGTESEPCCERCWGHCDIWQSREWNVTPSSFELVGSTRRFGVEIETSQSNSWRDLQKKTVWGCVYECSTGGKEFVSPILQGNEGFVEIFNFCRLARERDWEVDRSCGLHIHLDISKEDSESCLRIAYAYRRTYNLWTCFVPAHRVNNSMCGTPQYSYEDITTADHIEDFVEARDRFEFVNWRAYIRHGSFEVRIYPGTLNARPICKWISLHAQFMDAAKKLSFKELDDCFGDSVSKNWTGLNKIIENKELLDYWGRKAQGLGHHISVDSEVCYGRIY
jgi:Putative amidoligase enzyme